MKELQLLTAYLEKSNAITLAVLGLLSFYFIVVNFLFFYRYFFLSSWLSREKISLETLKIGSMRLAPHSFLAKCLSNENFSKESRDYCLTEATTKSTSNLTFLSIAASTSPFIGLFGTVVSILETFYLLGSTKASIATISSSIGEALVATAGGIFVAVFAYTYHLVLKRKAYEVVTTIKMQIDLLSGR